MKRAVYVAIALAFAPAQGVVAQQTTDWSAEIDALTERVAHLEGARAITNLQRAFGFYVDRGLWGEAADLFADDGTIELGVDGVYAGKERIGEYLRLLHGGQEGLIYGQLNEWMTFQPAVSVAADGLTATARWRDHAMLGQHRVRAEWRDGIYENTYVKDDGVWKIQSLHLFVNFVAPYDDGWARLERGEGLSQSETSRTFPPDRGPTVAYRPFPETQIPPFQAPHPVTGQPVKGAN